MTKTTTSVGKFVMKHPLLLALGIGVGLLLWGNNSRPQEELETPPSSQEEAPRSESKYSEYKNGVDIRFREDIADMRVSAPITRINLYLKISDANGKTYEKEVTEDGNCEIESPGNFPQRVVCDLGQ